MSHSPPRLFATEQPASPPLFAATPHAPSYYAATANSHPIYPPLCGDTIADVCVVGGGYTGLSAALHLAELGRKVVVLEGARIGWGGSGRNGGQIVSGFSGELNGIEQRRGTGYARALWAMAEESKDLLRTLVKRHHIACDLKRGYLFAAHNRRHLQQMRDLISVWQRYGYDQLELIDRRRTRDEVDSPRYVGGLYDHGGGHLHPLNFALGLGGAAAEAGAALHEGSQVTGLEALPSGGHVCRTATGSVRAAAVVLAGNAYMGSLAPQLSASIMPVATYMVATAPLGRDRARALIPNDIAICDFNLVVDYCRLSADHRLLFGSGARYWLGDPRDLKPSLMRRMTRIFPQLEGVEVDFAWGGYVAITMNRLPHLGRLRPGVWFAHGYSGQGVALATLAGKLMAEAITGAPNRVELFADIPHRPFPGGPVRAPLLALAMAYHRLRDLI